MVYQRHLRRAKRQRTVPATPPPPYQTSLVFGFMPPPPAAHYQPKRNGNKFKPPTWEQPAQGKYPYRLYQDMPPRQKQKKSSTSSECHSLGSQGVNNVR